MFGHVLVTLHPSKTMSRATSLERRRYFLAEKVRPHVEAQQTLTEGGCVEFEGTQYGSPMQPMTLKDMANTLQ